MPHMWTSTMSSNTSCHGQMMYIVQQWKLADLAIYHELGNFCVWKYSCIKYLGDYVFVSTPQKYFNMNICQLHLINVTVHVLLIMTTNYLAIATSLAVLQREICMCSLIVSIQTPSKIQSNVIRPVLCHESHPKSYPVQASNAC